MKDDFIKSIGIRGQRHYEHLDRHSPTVINVMRMNGTLEQYLRDIDCQAEEMLSQLVKQLAESEGVTEELKTADQMEWVRRMNAVREQVIEIVNSELIYA